jgi:enoyl-CoA hydratase
MDMILTGREVAAKEALEFGLANRICGRGKALEVALELANKLCEFPQVCMRSDRLSAMEQWDLTESVATKNEVKRGLEVIMSGETVNGAKYFLTGKGKHGSFDS